MDGGMEAIYLHMSPIGFARSAPALAPEGPFMSARGRIEGQTPRRRASPPAPAPAAR